jgi:AraC family transcriptional regulator, transcriptional activator of pobA
MAMQLTNDGRQEEEKNMSSEERLAERKRQDIPTLHFIYSTTDDLAFDCKRLEAMRLTARQAYRQTYYSLYWVVDGSATAGIDFVDYPLLSSTLTLLQPGQVFYPHVSTPLRGLALYFPRDFLALDSLGGANPFPLITGAETSVVAPLEVNRDQTPQIHQLMSDIAAEFSGSQAGRDTMVRAALSMLLVTASRLRPVTMPVSYPSLVQGFFDLIERNFCDTPRMSEYARLLGITPGYLNDVVKHATGQTASRVLHERILLEAKRLLVQTDVSVAEIATNLAFTDSSYFTRFFHRATGFSPRTFRQHIRSKSRNTRERSLEVS